MEKKPLIKEKVANELKSYISNLRSDEPVRIPSERDLSESFHVSRITLRAALKELVEEGSLIQMKGRGTYITPRNDVKSIHIMCSPKIKNTDPFYLKFLSELTNTASKQTINLYIVDSANIQKTQADIPLVIIGLLEDSDLLNTLISNYRTIIAIQDYNNYNDVLSQIYFNDYKIGCQAAQLLKEYGHEKLLLLSGPEKYPSSNHRKTGFMDICQKSGIKPFIYTEKMNWAGGYRCGDHIINGIPINERPTAVFAANDWMAIGLMQKLRENNIRIPEDISVVGCDDIPLANEYIPTLTTFNLDMRMLVTQLFNILSELSSAKDELTRKIVLPATLVLRDSLIRQCK